MTLTAKIKLLIASIRSLGLINGLRYFRVSLLCAKSPFLVLRWAELCEKQSLEAKHIGDLDNAHIFAEFSRELRESHDSWVKRAGEIKT